MVIWLNKFYKKWQKSKGVFNQKTFLKDLMALCFPPACLACKTSLSVDTFLLFCPTCLKQINLITEPLCTVCGKSFPFAAKGNHLCGLCLQHSWHFSQARAVVQYQGSIIKAMQKFKYGGCMAGLNSFAKIKTIAPHLGDMSETDIIIPVPLHIKRLRKRGFNQALLLSRFFFPQQKGLINTSLLIRSRWTAPQTTLSGITRRQNLKNAFKVEDQIKIKNKKIILVDDVFTTGATVNECAYTLKKAGAQEVQVLTMARVESENF